MFDANLRSLKKGRKFIAEVHGVKPTSALSKYGVVGGDVLLCRMLSIGRHNPRIVIYFPDGRKEVMRHWNTEKLLDELLVFSGMPDLKGFVSEHYREKTRELLKEFEK